MLVVPAKAGTQRFRPGYEGQWIAVIGDMTVAKEPDSRLRGNDGKGRLAAPSHPLHPAFFRASLSHVSTTVSGFSDIDSMPCSISHSARSGWSLGPCPQMPM